MTFCLSKKSGATHLLCLFLFLCSAPTFAIWRATPRFPVIGPSFYSASIDEVCRSVGAYHFGKIVGITGYAPIESWTYDGATVAFSDNLRTCTYTMTTISKFGDEQENRFIIYASYNHASNLGRSCNNTKYPINISIGNKFYSANEISSQLSVNRYYNSFSAAWSFDFMQRLYLYPGNGVASVKRADGNSFGFTMVDDAFISETHKDVRLSKDGDYYTLALAHNVIETYDSAGKLVSILQNEELTSLTYTDNNIVVKKHDYEITFVLDEEQVVQLLIPGVGEINYNYFKNLDIELLQTVKYEDGSELTYLYEDSRYPQYITGIEDEKKARISSVVYDDLGRAIVSEKGAPGSGIERTEVQFNSTGGTTVTNALGKQTSYSFGLFKGQYKIKYVSGFASENCAAANQRYTYDANGFVASKTDWNGVETRFTNNSLGQETSRTEAYGTPQARTTQTQWHVDLYKPTKIIEPERTTEYTYDAQGRLLNTKVSPTL